MRAPFGNPSSLSEVVVRQLANVVECYFLCRKHSGVLAEAVFREHGRQIFTPSFHCGRHDAVIAGGRG
jgi:hypothetical protein